MWHTKWGKELSTSIAEDFNESPSEADRMNRSPKKCENRFKGHNWIFLIDTYRTIDPALQYKLFFSDDQETFIKTGRAIKHVSTD